MAYVHHSNADVNRTITCSLTQSYTEVFIQSIPYSLTIILCVVDVLLAITSTLLNLLIMKTIISKPKLRTPSFVLLCNLALTDFAVGITFGPLELVYLISRAHGRYDVFCNAWKILTVSGYFLCSASLSTVTAISYDRYLSVSMPVKYKTVVTKKKSCYTVIIIWVCSVLAVSTIGVLAVEVFLILVCCVASLNLIVIVDCYLSSFAAIKQQKVHNQSSSLNTKTKSESDLSVQKNDLRLSNTDKRLSDYENRLSGFVIAANAKKGSEKREQKPSLLNLKSQKIEPSKSDLVARQMKGIERTAVEELDFEGKYSRLLDPENKNYELVDMRDQNKRTQWNRFTYASARLSFPRTDVQNFKKTQHTILIIVVALFVCYLPVLIVNILVSSRVINSGIVKNLAAIMVYMNSSINALIMCTRIPGIRSSCQKIIKKIFCRNK